MPERADSSRRKRPLDGADRVRHAAQAMKSRPLYKIPEFWLSLAPWLCLLLFGIGLLLMAVLL